MDRLVGGATVADDGEGVVDTVGAAGIAAARAARVDQGCPVPLLPEDRYRRALRRARSTPGVDLTAAPADNGYKGTDVNVIVLMSYGFASGFMQGVLGSSVHLAANTHMTVGGY